MVAGPADVEATAAERKLLSALLLTDRVPWFGVHSGYECLVDHLPRFAKCRAVQPRSSSLARYLGSALAQLRRRRRRGGASLAHIELEVRQAWSRPDITHILHVENHLELIGAGNKRSRNLVGTVHLPQAQWSAEGRTALRRLASAIVLYRRDLNFFEDHVGAGRATFIRHGVDTDFFRPPPAPPVASRRILYSGVWLRNEAMLVRVAMRLLAQRCDVKLEMLVPAHHRNSPQLNPLLNHPSVKWRGGLSDDELRTLYQECDVMLLPMNDSGANTAVVEALASGLPLVTTDVGGIRDYGGGSVYPVVNNDDDDAMCELVMRLVEDPSIRQTASTEARAFAVKELSWDRIARQHVAAYEELVS